MKCRRYVKDIENNKKTVVWFGSYGKNEDGTAKFYNKDNKHDNYSLNDEGLASSINQQLSVIEGELWYSIETGLPLFSKGQTKISIDTAISEIILGYQEVINIESFNSEVINNNYSANISINTIYGTLVLSV